ncbi:MAG: type II secretion system F family protein, partial [Firmicutes bacterium]|nr:type II secretion system F family protein [Bacillota bacterium]
GDKIEGEYQADDKQEVISMLRAENSYPLEIKENDKKNKDVLDIFNKVKMKDISLFCRQIYAMLNAGVTVNTSLEVLKEQTENKKMKETIGNVSDDVQKGETLTDAMKKYSEVFPDLLVNMIEVGEMSGNLDNIMAKMADYYERENKIRNKVKGAMVYPAILSIVTIFVVIFLLTAVLPTFVDMFTGSGVILPLPTRILLTISSLLKNYWYLFIIILSGLIFIFRRYKKSEVGRKNIDKIKFKIPIYKTLITDMMTTRFSRTLAIMITSGIPLMDALDIVSRVVGNKVVKEGISDTMDKMKQGSDLSTPIKDIKIFPPMLISMIKIGEESGALDTILDKAADYYDEELETSTKKLTTMIEPIMIVIMAIIVGFIVLSIALPMFDMVNTI